MGSPIPRVDDPTYVECFKCHKKGHYADKYPEAKAKDGKSSLKMRKIDDSGPKQEPEAKSVRQIRIRYSDIEDNRNDPFMRHWIILSNLGQIRLDSDNESHLEMGIFVVIGADCNTISRQFYPTLSDQGLRCAFYPGPLGGIDINLVGQRLGVSGDKTTFMTDLVMEVFGLIR